MIDRLTIGALVVAFWLAYFGVMWLWGSMFGGTGTLALVIVAGILVLQWAESRGHPR